MKVHIKELQELNEFDQLSPELTLTIDGDEAWLAAIYQDFSPPEGREAPRIKGKLKLRLEEAGTVQAQGWLQFAPFVACSRCEQPIVWPLDLAINVRYLPSAMNDIQKERNLSKADLDAYYLEDDQLDVEQLVNDAIQTNLPNRFLPLSEDGKSCKICQLNVTSEKVYGKADEKEVSPFAALKDLKLKH